jgi:hypothetical protein
MALGVEDKKKNTTVKTIRMSLELAQNIDKMAKEQNRNFSNMAETLLINAINQRY